MSNWRGPPAKRHDDITISAIRVAFVLSLLVHGAALWSFLPRMHLLTPTDALQGETGSPLAVQLAQPQTPPGGMPAASPPPEPMIAQQMHPRSAPPTKAVPRPPSAPRVIAVPTPSPETSTSPAAPVEAAPTPPQPASATDLAAYIESQRRARGERPSASDGASDSKKAEDENERQNKIIAANLGLNTRPSFGRDAKNGGGIFQVKTIEYSYAEFYFFGWDKDIGRNAKQVIEVRKGDNSDIRIAIVRRMIAIVREHEQGDFLWESHRLGRQLTLSARAGDNTELEAFMMKEFFFDVPNQH
jgi:hypothetical protein